MNRSLKIALNDAEYLFGIMQFHILGGLWMLPGTITSDATSHRNVTFMGCNRSALF